ncbi:hypothetical protein BC628DRAFT_1136151 [Trametes gibbosa]|nr:hypothetical protein BC628DRAFT_1136151 [Trametes gibbosa]
MPLTLPVRISCARLAAAPPELPRLCSSFHVVPSPSPFVINPSPVPAAHPQIINQPSNPLVPSSPSRRCAPFSHRPSTTTLHEGHTPAQHAFTCRILRVLTPEATRKPSKSLLPFSHTTAQSDKCGGAARSQCKRSGSEKQKNSCLWRRVCDSWWESGRAPQHAAWAHKPRVHRVGVRCATLVAIPPVPRTHPPHHPPLFPVFHASAPRSTRGISDACPAFHFTVPTLPCPYELPQFLLSASRGSTTLTQVLPAATSKPLPRFGSRGPADLKSKVWIPTTDHDVIPRRMYAPAAGNAPYLPTSPRPEARVR